MAVLSNSGTYLNITVRLWYDKNTKRVHVTSDDRDLKRLGGLSTNFKPGTAADLHVRALLVNNGISCGEAMPI